MAEGGHTDCARAVRRLSSPIASDWVGSDVKLVYLRGSRQLISERLETRHGHYMDPKLLASQFAVLEEPSDAIAVDVDADVSQIVAQIRKALSV